MSEDSKMPFEAIAQFIGSHERFHNLDSAHKLHFYALYKATHARAPSYSFFRRLSLFLTAQVEYNKWLAWWLVSDRYTGVQAEHQYYELAREIGAFPDAGQLLVMKTSSTRGKGASQLVVNDSTRNLTTDMDNLIDACANSDKEYIISYLSQGGDVNICNEEGTSLLHFAVDSNSLEIVHVLLQYGVNLEVRDDQGLSPIDSAKVNGEEFTDMVALLTSQDTVHI